MRNRTWNIGTNSRPEFRYGTLYVYDEPVWLAICNWFVNTVVSFPYTALGWVPLPSWPRRQWRHCKPGETYTLREYYGTLGDLWFAFVYTHCLNWVWDRRMKYEIRVELGFDRLRELFGDTEAEYFRQVDEQDEWERAQAADRSASAK